MSLHPSTSPIVEALSPLSRSPSLSVHPLWWVRFLVTSARSRQPTLGIRLILYVRFPAHVLYVFGIC